METHRRHAAGRPGAARPAARGPSHRDRTGAAGGQRSRAAGERVLEGGSGSGAALLCLAARVPGMPASAWSATRRWRRWRGPTRPPTAFGGLAVLGGRPRRRCGRTACSTTPSPIRPGTAAVTASPDAGTGGGEAGGAGAVRRVGAGAGRRAAPSRHVHVGGGGGAPCRIAWRRWARRAAAARPCCRCGPQPGRRGETGAAARRQGRARHVPGAAGACAARARRGLHGGGGGGAARRRGAAAFDPSGAFLVGMAQVPQALMRGDQAFHGAAAVAVGVIGRRFSMVSRMCRAARRCRSRPGRTHGGTQSGSCRTAAGCSAACLTVQRRGRFRRFHSRPLHPHQSVCSLCGAEPGCGRRSRGGRHPGVDGVGQFLRGRPGSEQHAQLAVGGHQIDERGVVHQVARRVLRRDFSVIYAICTRYVGNLRGVPVSPISRSSNSFTDPRDRSSPRRGRNGCRR